jgi:hypothetical protein
MKKLLAILVACLMPICLIAGSGDVNGDGKVNAADIVELLNHLNGKPTKNYNASEADANNDGVVDKNDAKAIADIVLGEQFQYFREESTGEEAIISSAGNVLLQKDNNDDGHCIEMCSYDAETKSFCPEKCVVVEMDQQEQVRSFVFSDFAICLNHCDNGQIGLFLIRYNGEYKKLCDVSLPAKSRAIESPENPSIIDRLSTINDAWNIIGEPLMANLELRDINFTNLAGNLTGLFLSKSIEIPLKMIGSDYSSTIGGLFSLTVEGGINIGLGEAAYFSNPWTAGLFLLTSYQEGREHIFKKTIGKDFSVSLSSVKRVSWDHYQANYTVSGIGESLVTPEIDFVYYPRDYNAGWAVFPKTITHFCLNQDYVQNMENLSPGPNKCIIDVYIDGWRFLGSFMRKEFDFFVGLNELADVKNQEYEQGDGAITQPLLVYSINHNEAYPLSDFGTYIRCDTKIERYSHTKNVVESSASGDGSSISAINQVTQQLKVKIDIDDLIPVSKGSNKKKPSQVYCIGAYSYNFNTGEYEYYDERPLKLEYSLTTACPDSNHPHWIDLGLPSGTQWRCCNEGASTPEAYGGYYEFGQVASAPSLDQIKELLGHTTSVWTTQNGVNGRKFTGSNGGTIFLPAAGERWYGVVVDVGWYGDYWSSTPRDEYDANVLCFTSDNAYWGSLYRLDGQSVRPVR